ncbi:MAG TPA: RnfABCDGE type electron transport complex subunit C [Clostridiales bacterium]|nr:RnfABCDGE type electron transport complex subunit C [Clostridiales bacterium]
MPINFPGGVHPPTKKFTDKKYISELTPAAKVYIPVVQHVGKPAKICVKEGDYVKIGALLASADGAVSANIFSSVSGKVVGIENRPTSNGEVAHIVIDNDFTDQTDFLPRPDNPTREEILKRIADCGIVGMGGAGFPTAAKLDVPKDDKIDTLILNGSECEPYITSDHRIMLEYPEQILKGAKYIAKALNVSNIIIGIEDNKKDAIDALNKIINLKNYSDIKVVSLKTKYPQGAEKQLIYSLTKRVVPACELPSKIGVVVNNVHTALSVYYAVWEGQPLYRRVVTVSGGAVKNKGNYWVRLGTTYKDILSECKATDSLENSKIIQDSIREKQGQLNKLDKSQSAQIKQLKSEIKNLTKELDNIKSAQCVMIVNGGPMMGEAAKSNEEAVTATTSSVLFLTQQEINNISPSQCINCGKCAVVCPMKLMPMFIDLACIAGDWADAKKYGAVDCILCGCCSYICPAKRDLVSSMKKSKRMIAKRGI